MGLQSKKHFFWLDLVLDRQLATDLTISKYHSYHFIDRMVEMIMPIIYLLLVLAICISSANAKARKDSKIQDPTSEPAKKLANVIQKNRRDILSLQE
jgi:hypothetical protein